MFSAALLVYSKAISVERTRKFGLTKAALIGFTGLVGLITKIESVVEVIRISTEMSMFIFAHAF